MTNFIAMPPGIQVSGFTGHLALKSAVQSVLGQT